jgi:hypothetical protein
MDQRGETALLDRQIETLMNRDKLTEEEVKVLCEKVSIGRRPRTRYKKIIFFPIFPFQSFDFIFGYLFDSMSVVPDIRVK